MPRSRSRETHKTVSPQTAEPLKEKLEEKVITEEAVALSLPQLILKDEGMKAALATHMGLGPKKAYAITPFVVEQHYAIYEETPLSYQKDMALRILPVQKEGHEWHERPSILLRRHLLEKAQQVVSLFDAHHPVSVRTWMISPSDFAKEGTVKDEFGDFLGVVKARRSKKGEIKSSLLAKAELSGGKKGRHALVFLLASATAPTAHSASQAVEELKALFKTYLKDYGKAILGKEGEGFMAAFSRAADDVASRHEAEVDALLVINKPARPLLLASFGEPKAYTFNGSVERLSLTTNPAFGSASLYNGRKVERKGPLKVNRVRAEALLYTNPVVSENVEFVAHYKDKLRALKRLLSSSKGARRNRDYSAALMWFL